MSISLLENVNVMQYTSWNQLHGVEDVCICELDKQVGYLHRLQT